MEIRTVEYKDLNFVTTITKLLTKITRIGDHNSWLYITHCLRSLRQDVSDWTGARPAYEDFIITRKPTEVKFHFHMLGFWITVKNNCDTEFLFKKGSSWYITCGYIMSILNYIGERLKKVTINDGERIMTVAQLNVLCSLVQIRDDYAYPFWDKFND